MMRGGHTPPSVLCRLMYTISSLNLIVTFLSEAFGTGDWEGVWVWMGVSAWELIGNSFFSLRPAWST